MWRRRAGRSRSRREGDWQQVKKVKDWREHSKRRKLPTENGDNVRESTRREMYRKQSYRMRLEIACEESTVAQGNWLLDILWLTDQLSQSVHTHRHAFLHISKVWPEHVAVLFLRTMVKLFGATCLLARGQLERTHERSKVGDKLEKNMWKKANNTQRYRRKQVKR